MGKENSKSRPPRRQAWSKQAKAHSGNKPPTEERRARGRVRQIVTLDSDALTIDYPSPGAEYDPRNPAYGTYTGAQTLSCKITDQAGDMEIQAEVSYPNAGQWTATFPPGQTVPMNATLTVRTDAGLAVRMTVFPKGFGGTVVITIPKPGQRPTLSFTALGTWTVNKSISGNLYDQNLNPYPNEPASINVSNDGHWSISFNPPPGQVYGNTTLQVCNSAGVCASMLLNPML
jgi:hypothetical protein